MDPLFNILKHWNSIPNPITRYNKGLTFLQLKELDKAIKRFDNAISNDEADSKAL